MRMHGLDILQCSLLNILSLLFSFHNFCPHNHRGRERERERGREGKRKREAKNFRSGYWQNMFWRELENFFCRLQKSILAGPTILTNFLLFQVSKHFKFLKVFTNAFKPWSLRAFQQKPRFSFVTKIPFNFFFLGGGGEISRNTLCQ